MHGPWSPARRRPHRRPSPSSDSSGRSGPCGAPRVGLLRSTWRARLCVSPPRRQPIRQPVDEAGRLASGVCFVVCLAAAAPLAYPHWILRRRETLNSSRRGKQRCVPRPCSLPCLPLAEEEGEDLVPELLLVPSRSI